uniref:Uncharacterized protein n=1 Tax=Brassica oleracea TaxID=3712 RepID=A0A3P6G5J0_BRAOL|nr:unnamed protein product [Brassica oleracea]
MAIFEVISKVLPSDLKSVGVLPDCCDSGRSGMLKAVGLCVLICSYWIQSQREIKESLIRSPTNNPKKKYVPCFIWSCNDIKTLYLAHQAKDYVGLKRNLLYCTGKNLTTSDLVKDHLRYLMGGRSSVEEEVLCKFTFPERPGALMNFLDSFSPRFSFVGDIDTSAPFESVREAATRFGGFGFWKPSSLNNIPKHLSLESTKAIVEELKSKLHRKEDNENCDMNVLKELNQAKTNLCKTTVDIAAISVFEIERTRSKIKAAEMRLVAARKMKEAARVAEAVAIAEIKYVTRSSRTRETLHEEILEKIEETAQEIRSSKRTIEEGLERVNSAKMEAEE